MSTTIFRHICIYTIPHNGTKFLSMHQFFLDHDIECQRTCVYTPKQNGVVERKHYHILTIARSLLYQSNLPIRFWGDCVLTAIYVINRLPSPILSNKTPFQLLYNQVPFVTHLRIFSNLCYATVNNPKDKFDPLARWCVFIGYPPNHKGYKLYNLEDNTVFVNSDMVFSRNHFSFYTLLSYQIWSLT